ncbi:MAG: 50S ribosomal protein L13 [Kiritimatiellia bacterium]
MKSFRPRSSDEARKWHVVDAADRPLGRLAVDIANVLRGKNRPTYDPSVDQGDFVVVINADKIRMTGRKLAQKKYDYYSGWRGGRKVFAARTMMENHPDRVIMQAVRGMLPRNRIARKMMTRIRVYRGEEHPHQAQKPEVASF